MRCKLLTESPGDDIVFFNGAFVPRDRALVSIDDRGFIFADAVYEALRATRGVYFEPQRHLARLHRGLAALRLPVSETIGIDLLAAGLELIRANRLDDAPVLVYTQISRGAAPRAHAFPPGARPTTLITVRRLPYQDERDAGVRTITRPDLRWGRCDLKTVNLLPNLLANQEAAEAGAYEAILLRRTGVTEATHCNVFAVVDGVLRTHPADRSILPGVTRGVVLDIARRAGAVVAEVKLSRRELFAAEEVFLTGTSTGVTPVIGIDGCRVGQGVPGPVTEMLRRAYRSRLGTA